MASCSNTIRELPNRFPDLRSNVDCLFEASEKQGTIAYSLHRACPEDKELSEFLNRRKLQHSLTQDYFNLVSSSSVLATEMRPGSDHYMVKVREHG